MTPVQVAIALIRREDQFFLQRRDPGSAWLPGLWEFPGGKLLAGESPLEGLVRELREELDWSPASVEPLASFRHAYPGRAVVLHPFLCAGPEAPRTALAWGWFTPRAMTCLPTPAANAGLIRRLMKFHGRSMS